MEVFNETPNIAIKSQRSKAFTMAEVLVTLGIIGLLAEMTLPALINNVGERSNKTAWKKKYSEINQVVKRMTADYNIPYSPYVTFKDGFADYMLYSKKCTMARTEGCWHQKWYNLEGTQISLSLTDGTGYILNDGSLFLFRDMFSSLPPPAFDDITAARSISFAIDVNGFKGPNKNGYDIFGGYLGGQGIYLFPAASGNCNRNQYAQTVFDSDFGCAQNVILGIDY